MRARLEKFDKKDKMAGTSHYLPSEVASLLNTYTGEESDVLIFPSPRLSDLTRRSTVKVAVLVGSQLATTSFFDWIRRLGAALRTQEKRPGTLDPTERPGRSSSGYPSRHLRCV